METLFALVNNAIITAYNSGAHPWVHLNVNTKDKEIKFWSQSFDSKQQVKIKFNNDIVVVGLSHYGDMDHHPDEQWEVKNINQLVDRLNTISTRWYNISYINQYLIDTLVKLTNGAILEGKQ